jgi:hypothetical protein
MGKGGGGGKGGVDIPKRNLTEEFTKIFKHGLPLTEKGYQQFWQNEPLLTASHDYALQNLANVGQLTGPMQALLGKIPGQFAGYQSDLSRLQGQIPGYQRDLSRLQGQIPGYQQDIAGYKRQLGNVYSNLPNVQRLTSPLESLIGSQRAVYAGLQPTLMRQGALTGEQARDITQATRQGFAERGMVTGNQALGRELLNRDIYRQQRFQNALGSALGLSGSIGGLTGEIGGLRAQDVATRQGLLGAEAGLTGAQAGLTGMGANLIGQQAGLTGMGAGLIGQQAGLDQSQAGILSGLGAGIQGLQTGALNQALGTEKAQVGSYATLVNPLLGYGQDLFSSNQNAAATENAASSNKSSGLMSGLLGLGGSIAIAL